jgi:UDP-N-acetyl-2-amino-2-deoxyglucuronate dehydrogenase
VSVGDRPPWRVGIIGCGNVAFNDHAPSYLALPELFEVVAIADPSAERRAIVGDRLGIASGDRHDAIDALLARPDLDVVDICTPPALHRAIVEAVSATGRHILCEKPLATTPADAVAIAATVRAAGIAFGMIHNYLWFPEVVATQAVIASGDIGDVQAVLIDSLGIDDNPGVPGYRPRWRHETGAGGGVLMDLIHLVYLAEALLGSPIRRVSATIDAADPEAIVESLALCRFEADSGTALVNVGWGVGPGGLRVSGSSGRVEVRYRDGATGPYLTIEVATTFVRGRDPEPLVLDGRRDTHRATLEDFGRALVEGRPPAADVDAGVRSVTATVAAYEAAASGTSVAVPLAPADPVFRDGATGLRALDLPDWSVVRRRGLFGVERA